MGDATVAISHNIFTRQLRSGADLYAGAQLLTIFLVRDSDDLDVFN